VDEVLAPSLGAELPAARRRHLTWWLLAGAALTFAMLVVGGITRLTQSGLSIVEWAPLMGVMPPIGEAQWQEAFDAYKRYPEYQQLRPTMTLAEYRFIFYWEYAHRLLARAIGVVFLVPFLVFLARRYLRGPLLRRLLLLFGLGALQGARRWRTRGWPRTCSWRSRSSRCACGRPPTCGPARLPAAGRRAG